MTYPIHRRNFIDILPWCVKVAIAAQVLPELESYRDSKGRLDLGDAETLSVYNRAVAKTIANINLTLPPGNLTPTVCLRQSYLVCLVDELLRPGDHILEIGTGASAIIALLANILHGLKVTATEIDDDSFRSAQQNIHLNSSDVELIRSDGGILDGVIPDGSSFDAMLSYPPIYPEEDRKFFLGDKTGFGGTSSEMIGGGRSGFKFTGEMLQQACSGKYDISYITVLLILKEHVEPAVEILTNSGRYTHVIELKAGTRRRYLVMGSHSPFL